MKTLIIAALAGCLAVHALAKPPLSGLQKGESVTPFHPKHLAGPLAGTSSCFPCTFQNRPQVQAWITGDTPENVVALAQSLDKAMNTYKGKEFKALIVYVVEKGAEPKTGEAVKAYVKAKGLKNVGISVLDRNSEFVNAYKIALNSDVKNTVLVYKDWKVTKNLVNVSNADARAELDAAIAAIAR